MRDVPANFAVAGTLTTMILFAGQVDGVTDRIAYFTAFWLVVLLVAVLSRSAAGSAAISRTAPVSS